MLYEVITREEIRMAVEKDGYYQVGNRIWFKKGEELVSEKR